MKKAINNQVQDEVKELLNEYVVSPLNNDITQTLGKVLQQVGNLQGNIENIMSLSNIVSGNIQQLKQSLNYSSNFEDISGSFTDLEDTLNELVEYAELLPQIKEMFDKVREENLPIITSQKTLLDNLKQLANELNEIDNNINAISQLINNTNQSIGNDFKAVSNKLNEISDDILVLSKKTEQVNVEIKDTRFYMDEVIIAKIESLKENISETSVTITDYYNKLTSGINDVTLEVNRALGNSKYKIMFVSLMLFSAVNFVGMIIMLILLCVK